MVSMKATTKTTKKQPRRTRTEQELLAEIKKLASELTDHNAQHRIRMAVQDIQDWRGGKAF
jgi:glutamate-1-semialdehyde aminotransferase